ncbi:MAG: F420-dependent NADP oxidoreductase [Bacteroidaceae bacterium]|nr:F420-dependent NADP oxidoreductase [Bacteroidaceae bacterium]
MDTLNKIVFIGAGNLATNLATALVAAGCSVTQVFSRTTESAEALAQRVGAASTTTLTAIDSTADLYIVSLKDSALIARLDEIAAIHPTGFFVHTAGSIAMDIWEDKVAHYGVFYPMQTFSKERLVDFSEIPLFLEASDAAHLLLLQQLAHRLTSKVYLANSLQRKYLHLSAVFACNFANQMYAISAHLLEKHQLPFDVMLPLIDETARKVHTLSPLAAQTGPAVRYDENVIQMQSALLQEEPLLQTIYEKMSQQIHTSHTSTEKK